MSSMARLQFGRLTEAWKGEASDFTPLLAEQLDAIGAEIGIDLASIGESEVQTTGGRRIDIVAQGEDGSEFVIENQYGRADHDHLTRGLAYAVARRARGLIVLAEEHRDEFRAVANYLNDLAELDSERGIAVWLVEARAVRIEDSPWAPLFAAVVEPNVFTATVEQAKQSESPLGSIEEFWDQFNSPMVLGAAQQVLSMWLSMGHRRRLGPNHVVLEAAGPSKNGFRTVVAVYSDGRILVPFSSYAGQNSGIPIDSLTTAEFRSNADALFGFGGSERQARTAPGRLTPERTDALVEFCTEVATAYGGADGLAKDEASQ
ncbi:MAG: hypothetical protein HYX32_08035 [Actinobacteria bacterium]|nr:hypothetical protein [Actinomycetota bacterium]